jgi:flagellar basal-body rod protein FlgG
MIRSLYTAATGMEAQSLRIDVIANNLANSTTTAFKRTRAEFEDLLSDTIRGASAPDPRGGTSPAPLQVGLGVRTGGTSRSWQQGELLGTHGKLDLAIEGPGFFQVRRQDGSFAYTRAGNLRVDATGRLANQRGELVEPGISVHPETLDLTIQGNGLIMARVSGSDVPQEIGQLERANFPNASGLEAIGGNMFVQTPASGDPILARPGEQGTGLLNQGFLEGSNVKAVEEMIDMISAQRGFELSSKVISTADQMLQKLTTLR